jgi:hypothetical protein
MPDPSPSADPSVRSTVQPSSRALPGRLAEAALLLVVSIGLAVLGSPQVTRPIDRYKVGDFTARAIRAPYDLTVVDEVATQEQRDAAARRSPIVAAVESGIADTLAARFTGAWSPVLDSLAARKAQGQGNRAPAGRARSSKPPDRKATTDDSVAFDAALAETVTRLGITVPEAVRQHVLAAGDARGLVTAFRSLAMQAYRTPVIVDASAIVALQHESPHPAPPPVLLVDASTRVELGRVSPDTLRTLGDVRLDVTTRATEIVPAGEADVSGWLASVLVAWSRPSAVPDPAATRERRTAAVGAVLPVSLAFQRNQLVIGEGQPVSRQTLLVLDALRQRRMERSALKRVAGRAGVLFAMLMLAFWTIHRPYTRSVIDRRHLPFGLASLVGTSFAFRIWHEVAAGLAARYPSLPEAALVLCFPATATVIHASLVLPFRAAATYLALQSLCLGVLWQMDMTYLVYLLVAGTVGALLASRCERRQCVLRAALWAGLVVLPLAVCLTLLVDMPAATMAWTAAGAAAGCTLSGLAAIALSPVFESAFGHLTRIRLVELMNYQHPLLRRLTETTPGTFQHSVTVGLLVDLAARAINANALLVRVGALYHDVGKTETPGYFVENQHGENPHDRIGPRESAQAIIRHVEDGVRLVREAGLGERIADFVREHHGTSQVRYFLSKAVDAGDPVDETAFTYPGPKPRSRETGLLMIADQIEATARAMDEPTEEHLRQMVHATVSRLLEERQLDDCPLTLAELSAVERAFVQALCGVHHRRIKYPAARRTAAPAS